MSAPNNALNSSNDTSIGLIKPLPSEAEVNAKKISLINELIKRTKSDFSSCFTALVNGLYAVYSDKKYKISAVYDLVSQDKIEMSGVVDWYARNLLEQSGEILALSVETGIPEKDGGMFILPGVTAKSFMYRDPISDSRTICNAKAVTLIAENLPRLFMWSQMLDEIAHSRQDLSTLDGIIAKSYNRQKNWRERRVREVRVLSINNLQANCQNMSFGVQKDTLFPETSVAISPITVTLIKLVVYQSGLNSTILNLEKFNSMLAEATDDKVKVASEQLKDFFINVGVQRYIAAGGIIADVAERCKLDVVMEPTSMVELEDEKAKPGRVVMESTRRIPVIRFCPTAEELPAYRARAGCRVGKNAAGDNVVVMPVNSPEEAEMEMLINSSPNITEKSKRNMGYIEVTVPLISYTTTDPIELTDVAVAALEARGCKTVTSYRVINAVKLSKEMEASEIAQEVMIMVMRQIRSLPQDVEPIDRAIKTFNTLSAQLSTEPRYKDFSIRDVFVAIMVYAKNEPIVKNNPKLFAVVERIQQFAANVKTPTDEERALIAKNAAAGIFDASELDDVKEIVIMALDSTGNGHAHHVALVNRCIKCFVDFKTGNLDPSEVSGIVTLASQDGFFRTDVALAMIAGATGSAPASATTTASAPADRQPRINAH